MKDRRKRKTGPGWEAVVRAVLALREYSPPSSGVKRKPGPLQTPRQRIDPIELVASLALDDGMEAAQWILVGMHEDLMTGHPSWEY